MRISSDILLKRWISPVNYSIEKGLKSNQLSNKEILKLRVCHLAKGIFSTLALAKNTIEICFSFVELSFIVLASDIFSDPYTSMFYAVVGKILINKKQKKANDLLEKAQIHFKGLLNPIEAANSLAQRDIRIFWKEFEESMSKILIVPVASAAVISAIFTVYAINRSLIS